ncbi:glycosyltransferase [Candidatus Pacearchaeota archaeon]|nr:glycosyltransferase [Candidatus Pacearchaeota archaeon]
MKLIAVIPAFNEEQNIANVIKNIPRKISGIKEIKVLVMDDNSRDRTAETAKSAGADFVIKNKQNLGLGKNFKKGIETALKLKADIIVNIDADNQFNPRDIPKLIQPILDNEADMVTCSRFLNPQLTKNMPFAKKWGNRRFTNLISRITNQKFTDTQCGFRAYSKEAALRLNLQGRFTYTQEVFIDLAEKGIKIKEIPLEVNYFRERKSNISGKLGKYGLKSIAIIARATRDTQPLTFFGVPGAIIFLLGIIGAGFSFWYWLTHLMTTPVRQLFNVSVFFLIFGLSLGVLALLADMLKTLKANQEEILYRLKKKELEMR